MAIKVDNQPSTLVVFWVVSLCAQVTFRHASVMRRHEKVTHHRMVCHASQQDPRDVASLHSMGTLSSTGGRIVAASRKCRGIGVSRSGSGGHSLTTRNARRLRLYICPLTITKYERLAISLYTLQASNCLDSVASCDLNCLALSAPTGAKTCCTADVVHPSWPSYREERQPQVVVSTSCVTFGIYD